MEYLKEWNWTPRYKEVVVMSDYKEYRFYGGCPGQTGRRLVTKFGGSVDEEVEYFKGYGWLTSKEKWLKDSKRKKGKRKKTKP